MALAHVQTVKGTGAATSSVTTSGVTTSSGNLLLAVAGAWQSGVQNTHTITDSNSNTWVEVTGSPLLPTSNTKHHLFYAKNCTGGASHTFTTTIGGTALITLFVMEVSGADTTSPFDKGAGAVGNSTAPSSGATATRTQANEIIIGALGTGDNINLGTITAGSGFTIPANGSHNLFANYVSAIEYQIVSAAGTDAATYTISSDFWGCIVGTFKEAAVAGAANKSNFATRQAVKRASYY